MAVNNSQECITLIAGADLSTKQYRFVSLASDGQIDPTGDGLLAAGVLQDNPAAAGRSAAVCISGRTKVEAGGTIAAGGSVSSGADGVAVATASGDVPLGTAVDGGASGAIISIIFQPR
jgi:hypothetical protein